MMSAGRHVTMVREVKRYTQHLLSNLVTGVLSMRPTPTRHDSSRYAVVCSGRSTIALNEQMTGTNSPSDDDIVCARLGGECSEADGKRHMGRHIRYSSVQARVRVHPFVHGGGGVCMSVAGVSDTKLAVSPLVLVVS